MAKTKAPSPAFRRGAEAAKEASKGGGQFAKTHYFQIEDGKDAVIRFITDYDKWIVVDQHQNIPTKPKPESFEGTNWPERMSAVCRHDEAFKGIYDDCFICDFMVDGKKIRKPSGRTWALACLREEVMGDGSDELGGPEMKGKSVGWRDQVREIAKQGEDGKPTGETFEEKAIVIVNMGYKNFFSIVEGYGGRYHTVLDRDFYVKRSGGGTDTTYQVIGLDPNRKADDSILDLRNPEDMKRYGFADEDEALEAVGNLVAERADDEFYARFFDTRYTVKDDQVVSTGKVAEVAKPDNETSPERLAELASRVKGYKAAAPSEATEEAEEEPAAEAKPEKKATKKAASSGPRDLG